MTILTPGLQTGLPTDSWQVTARAGNPELSALLAQHNAALALGGRTLFCRGDGLKIDPSVADVVIDVGRCYIRDYQGLQVAGTWTHSSASDATVEVWLQPAGGAAGQVATITVPAGTGVYAAASWAHETVSGDCYVWLVLNPHDETLTLHGWQLCPCHTGEPTVFAPVSDSRYIQDAERADDRPYHVEIATQVTHRGPQGVVASTGSCALSICPSPEYGVARVYRADPRQQSQWQLAFELPYLSTGKALRCAIRSYLDTAGTGNDWVRVQVGEYPLLDIELANSDASTHDPDEGWDYDDSIVIPAGQRVIQVWQMGTWGTTAYHVIQSVCIFEVPN
jgi:hypothetical protein